MVDTIPESTDERGYREPARRPPIPESARRWYIKHGDGEKGPFDAKELARSVQNGVLRRTSVVRSENDADWRPLKSVAALTSALHRPAPRWSDDLRESDVGIARRDESRVTVGGTIGKALSLLGGLALIVDGVMGLSGRGGSILIAMGAVGAAWVGVALRKPSQRRSRGAR